jgi:D-amino-acid oxidase
MINRRSFLQGSGAVAGLSAMGLAGCTRHVMVPIAPTATGTPTLPFYDAVGPIIPIRADMDRIFRITVCTRPFRPAGPRQDVERVGDKVVMHNYGHGGSGWSLSWGSADVVVRKVLADGSAQREVAVIGAGALGLTAALTAQRAGLKERPTSGRCARQARGHRIRGLRSPRRQLRIFPRGGRRWHELHLRCI